MIFLIFDVQILRICNIIDIKAFCLTSHQSFDYIKIKFFRVYK